MCTHVCTDVQVHAHISTCAHEHMHTIVTCVCTRDMHTCLHVHMHAHVFTHRLRGDLCMARFQLEALRVTRVLRAWGGILATENQAVSCWPHALGQGRGRGPCYLVQGTQGPLHTWGGSAHLHLPKLHACMCSRGSLWPLHPAPPLLLSTHLTKWRRQPGFQLLAHNSMVEATWRPGNPEREGKAGRTQEV